MYTKRSGAGQLLPAIMHEIEGNKSVAALMLDVRRAEEWVSEGRPGAGWCRELGWARDAAALNGRVTQAVPEAEPWVLAVVATPVE